MKAVCVYCGSNTGRGDRYAVAARALGRAIAERGVTLVYGGGGTGLMGVLADSVLAGGGQVTGIALQRLVEKEMVHAGLTELHVVESMHERKAMMARLSDAFIAAPGGYGTLDEFSEVLTWTQLGIQRKPCGLLNVDGFYDPLLGFIDHLVAEQFLKQPHRDMVVVEHDPEALLRRLADEPVPDINKWYSPPTTSGS